MTGNRQRQKGSGTMIILIIGYPESGKSALAEGMAMKMSEPGERLYLATMIPCGDEGIRRIEKHRRQRAGKGFITAEVPFDIAGTLACTGRTRSEHDKSDSTSHSIKSYGNYTVLLECMSNLVANEMFERHTPAEEITDRITGDVRTLSDMVQNLIIVSNHYEITPEYDEETADYCRTLDEVNDEIAVIADKVIYM